MSKKKVVKAKKTMIEQTILLRYLEGNATDEERESVVEMVRVQ